MVAEVLHRFNVEEYYRMAETGVLPPDARVELLDGQIIDMSPIGPFHSGVTTFLTSFFGEVARRRWLTSSQIPVHLNDFSEPQPDLLLLKPAADCYRKRHAKPSEVYLLIEVSDTSLKKDQELKLPIYARAGVGEVWIVNLDELTVEVYRKPRFNSYRAKVVLYPGDKAIPQAFPDVALDVAEFLKR